MCFYWKLHFLKNESALEIRHILQISCKAIVHMRNNDVNKNNNVYIDHVVMICMESFI